MSRGAARRRFGRRGNMLLTVTILIPVLAGILSLAIDFGYVMMVRNELQGTADAAALAGSGGLVVSPAEARLRAKTIAAQNHVNGYPLTLLDSDIQLGTWDTNARTFTVLTGSAEAQANAVRVNGEVSAARNTGMRLLMLPLISSSASNMVVRRSATALAQRSTADVVIVQDVSGSFTAEIGQAKAGDMDLLGSLNTTGSQSAMGLVAFTGTSQTVTSIKKVATNYWSLQAAVNSLGCDSWGMPSTNSGTDIAAGMEQAQALFDAYNSSNKYQYMVIVSDGEPSANDKGKHPSKNATQLLNQAQADADAAYASGIDVFVVFWDSANNPTAAANLKSLTRGRGVFIHVTDPTKISEAIATVLARANSIVK